MHARRAIAVSDHIRVQQAVWPLLLPDIGNLAKDLIALDGTVDDDVSDVNTARPEFACEGLTILRPALAAAMQQMLLFRGG
jgi:hypothetical protein